jgi:hypothetical protein
MVNSFVSSSEFLSRNLYRELDKDSTRLRYTLSWQARLAQCQLGQVVIPMAIGSQPAVTSFWRGKQSKVNSQWSIPTNLLPPVVKYGGNGLHKNVQIQKETTVFDVIEVVLQF